MADLSAACIEKTLSMLPSNNTGLPRVSLGAVVDGKYIPEGVSASFGVILPRNQFYN